MIEQKLKEVLEEVSAKVNELNENFSIQDIEDIDILIREKIDIYFSSVGEVVSKLSTTIGQVITSIDEERNELEKSNAEIKPMLDELQNIAVKFRDFDIDKLKTDIHKELNNQVSSQFKVLSTDINSLLFTQSKNLDSLFSVQSKDSSDLKMELKQTIKNSTDEITALKRTISEMEKSQKEMALKMETIIKNSNKVVRDPILDELKTQMISISNKIERINIEPKIISKKEILSPEKKGEKKSSNGLSDVKN